eukprot:1148992-Pelagomonas_calceolata.AAC.2
MCKHTWPWALGTWRRKPAVLEPRQLSASVQHKKSSIIVNSIAQLAKQESGRHPRICIKSVSEVEALAKPACCCAPQHQHFFLVMGC